MNNTFDRLLGLLFMGAAVLFGLCLMVPTRTHTESYYIAPKSSAESQPNEDGAVKTSARTTKSTKSTKSSTTSPSSTAERLPTMDVLEEEFAFISMEELETLLAEYQPPADDTTVPPSSEPESSLSTDFTGINETILALEEALGITILYYTKQQSETLGFEDAHRCEQTLEQLAEALTAQRFDVLSAAEVQGVALTFLLVDDPTAEAVGVEHTAQGIRWMLNASSNMTYELSYAFALTLDAWLANHTDLEETYRSFAACNPSAFHYGEPSFDYLAGQALEDNTAFYDISQQQSVAVDRAMLYAYSCSGAFDYQDYLQTPLAQKYALLLTGWNELSAAE